MSEYLLSLVADYGVAALALTTFLSCLALPVPASLAMLAGGGFVAAGDLSAPATVAAALAGAVLGDQTGYAAGKWLGSNRLEGIAARRRRGNLLRQAVADLRARGFALVFFSRWLVSPLGPYVNLAAGAARLSWAQFTLGGVAGEAVWVGLYVGLGAAFTSRLDDLAALLGNLSGLLAAIAVAVVAGLWLLRAARRGGSPG